MLTSFDPLMESVNLMIGEVTSPVERMRASKGARMILEDADSPITRKHQEKLFQAVIDKGHIDFGDIPKSAGDLTQYAGYSSMLETLHLIKTMAQTQGTKTVESYADAVLTAIRNLCDLSATFKRGFQRKNEYVMLEYNLYTYCCIEATSTILYGFVDFVKNPMNQKMTVRLTNTRIRPDLFYLEQIQKFNNVQEQMGIDYRKMLEGMLNSGRKNFIGIDDAVVGYAAIALAAMAIVPISREIVYRVYNTRKNISNALELQAQFLEMNKASVEHNENLSPDKRAKVVQRQANLANKFRQIASKLRVDTETGIKTGNAKLKKDNGSFDLKTTTADAESSAIRLL